mmetsp:Transcript_23852/g.42239  ORF Transcript_23852/g.42239 Transcript_23852/m.42239 type:complete len:325 (-) Transcript_23852:195-1169(-)
MAGRRRQDDWGPSTGGLNLGEYRGIDKFGQEQYRQELLYQQQVKQMQKEQERLEKQIEARLSQQQAQLHRDAEDRRKMEDKLQKRNLADMYAYQVSQSRDSSLSALAAQEQHRSNVVDKWVRQGLDEQQQRMVDKDSAEYRQRQQRNEYHAQYLKAQMAEKERQKQLDMQASRAYGNEVKRNANAYKAMEEQAVIERKIQQADYMQTLATQVGSRGTNRQYPGAPSPSTIRNSAARIVSGSGPPMSSGGGKENTFEDNITAFFGSEAGDDYQAPPPKRSSPYGGQVDYFSKPNAVPSGHNPISNPIGGQMPKFDGRPMYRARGY